MGAVVELIKDEDGFMKLRKLQEIPAKYANRDGAYLSYNDIVDIAEGMFDLSAQATEHMYLIAFDTRMHVLGILELGHGSEYEVNFEMRELFAALMLMRAARFVLIHNHVHGVTVPSNGDQLKTIQVQEASRLMGFHFLNHIVVGDYKYRLIIDN